MAICTIWFIYYLLYFIWYEILYSVLIKDYTSQKIISSYYLFISACFAFRHGCDTIIASRRLDVLKNAAEKLSKATGQRCLPIQMDVRKVLLYTSHICIKYFKGFFSKWHCFIQLYIYSYYLTLYRQSLIDIDLKLFSGNFDFTLDPSWNKYWIHGYFYPMLFLPIYIWKWFRLV